MKFEEQKFIAVLSLSIYVSNKCSKQIDLISY